MSNADQHPEAVATARTVDDRPAEPMNAPSSVSELFRLRSVIMITLIGVVIAAFANSVGNEFVYDDLPSIVDSPLMGNWDPAAIKLLLTSDVGSSFRMEQGVNGPYYRPVFLLFLMVVSAITGARPAGWHAASILLHALATVLVFLVLERAIRQLGRTTRSRSLAALAAGIFAVHPLQTESVAWVSGLTGPLSGLFLLGSLYCYLTFREAIQNNRWKAVFAASLFLYVISLMAKESAIVLPLMILCYEFIASETDPVLSARRRAAAASLLAIPFAVVTVVYLGARSLIGFSYSVAPSANYPDDATLTLIERLQVLPMLAVSYVRLALAPVGLSPSYDLNHLRVPSMSSFWLPLAVLLAAAVAVFLVSRRRPVVKFAALLAIAPILPSLNVTAFPSGELLHDRYLYLSLTGAGLLIALLIEKAALQLKLSSAMRRIIAGIVLVSLLTATIAQNTVWTNNDVLWSHAVKHAPGSRVAHLWLGALAEDRQDLETALAEYNAVLEVDPRVLDALNNSAFVCAHMGRWDEAAERFERVASIVPANAMSHFNLAVAYAAQKRFADEAAELRAAIDLAGNDAGVNEWRARLDYLEAARPKPAAAGDSKR